MILLRPFLFFQLFLAETEAAEVEGQSITEVVHQAPLIENQVIDILELLLFRLRIHHH